MKKALIIIASIVSAALLVYFFFINPIGIVKMNSNEKIVNASADGSVEAMVTENGDVYIKGYVTDECNYGVKNVWQYRCQWFNSSARIYDKKDAVFVKLSGSGGCIVTDQSDVYVFINGFEEYQAPTYLCSGYTKAILAGDKVYLLSEDGSFGYVSVSLPDVFHSIGDGIVDFDVEYSKDNQYDMSFALTKDNRLYLLNDGETISDSNLYLDGIIGFDTVAYNAYLGWKESKKDNVMRNHIEVSLLSTDRKAYLYEGYLDEDYSKLVDIENYSVTGSDISHVTSFKMGIAMLNSKGEVSLYGNDFGSFESRLLGETYFDDVSAVFSGNRQLLILYSDGHIDSYGYDYGRGGTKYIL